MTNIIKFTSRSRLSTLFNAIDNNQLDFISDEDAFIALVNASVEKEHILGRCAANNAKQADKRFNVEYLSAYLKEIQQLKHSRTKEKIEFDFQKALDRAMYFSEPRKDYVGDEDDDFLANKKVDKVMFTIVMLFIFVLGLVIGSNYN